MWIWIGLFFGAVLGALAEQVLAGAGLGLALGIGGELWLRLARVQTQVQLLSKQISALQHKLHTDGASSASDASSQHQTIADPADPNDLQTELVSVVTLMSAEPERSLPVPVASQSVKDLSGRKPVPMLFQQLWAVLAGVNPLVLAGLAVLFLGLSFLATYFAHQGLLSMQVRLGFIGLTGAGLIGLGWWKRLRLGSNAVLLQGAGFAVVYLCLFAACKYYPMISPGVAFVLMLLTVLAGSGFALAQHSQRLAILATAGGFLVPILTSDGSNRFVALFGYYLLLNAGVLLLAWLRQWRWLNWTGFVATFVISLSWQLLQYRSADYLLVQPFFAAFFLLYLLIGYRFTLRQGHQSRGLIDGSLVFGLPLLSFSQQLLLTEHFRHGDGISAAVYALVYAGLYALVRRQQRDDLQRFAQIQLGLALMFASLILPFSFGASWTTVGWALEAAGLCWLGYQQQSRASRVGAYLLMLGALLAFALQWPAQTGALWFVQGDFINWLVLGISLLLLCISADLRPAAARLLPAEAGLAICCFMLGWYCWHRAFFAEFAAHLDTPLPWQLIMAAASLLLSCALVKRWPLPSFSRFGWLFLPLAWWLYGNELALQLYQGVWGPVLSWQGAVAVLVTVVAYYRWLQPQAQPHAVYLLGMPWLLSLLLLWQGHYLATLWSLEQRYELVLLFSCLTLPVICSLWLTLRQLWPHPAPLALFLRILPLPWLGLLLWLWYLALLWPTAGWPLLNLNDLLMTGCIGLSWLQLLVLRRELAAEPYAELLLKSLSFISATTLLVRAIQLSLGLPWQWSVLWQSSEVQLGLAIGWTLLALALMFSGDKAQHRLRWQAGAALLALVLLKLFLVDLADAGSLSRIVSFITVGGLTVLIGIKAPLPAAKQKAATHDTASVSAETADESGR
ncbi:DUF2339 domain-containing protein [Rheinheimera sp.]|uniref:DUF2339 domain-containing protein n=1 Tax=Rheinheimera sp. TaxID=1869214 RepID=UPI003AF7A2F1